MKTTDTWASDILRRRHASLISWHPLTGGIEVAIRRPMQTEALRLFETLKSSAGEASIEDVLKAIDQAKAFVTDWKGMTEGDLIEGGGDGAVAFSPELLDAWLGDHVPEGDEIVRLVFDKIAAQRTRLGEEKKVSRNTPIS